MVRAFRQQERQWRPEQGEQAECQQAEQRAQAQHRFFGEQAEHRADQRRVFQPGMAVVLRQAAVQRHGGDGHQHCSQHVDAAPATQFGHEPGGGTREQDAQQQPAHQRADRAPALVWLAEGRGHGHEDLRHHREQPGQRRTKDQPGQARCAGADDQAQGGNGGHHGDQPALLEQVAQRRQQQQAGAIAQLRGNDDAAGTGGAQAELLGDAVQQWLRIVVAGHGQAGGGGHQQDQGAAESGGVHAVLVAGRSKGGLSESVGHYINALCGRAEQGRGRGAGGWASVKPVLASSRVNPLPQVHHWARGL
ncbi:hypothetical protein D3C76_670830 [compost metagenome]